MIGKGVKEEKPVTLSEVYAILKVRKKAGELEYGQRLTYDYSQKFVSLSVTKAKALIKELLEIEKVREHQAVYLADLLPDTAEEIQLIFAKERTSLGDDDVKKILEIVGKYRK